MTDYDLDRFVRAQERTIAAVLAELERGRKTTHWMWFVFPQVAGLGSSPTAHDYAIRSAEEAREYVVHPVLGPRLIACSELLLQHEARSATDILGTPDDLKLRSSMTLFASCAPDVPIFGRVLHRYYDGEPDTATLDILRGWRQRG